MLAIIRSREKKETLKSPSLNLSTRRLSSGFRAEVLVVPTIIHSHLITGRPRRGENVHVCPVEKDFKKIVRLPCDCPPKTTQNALEGEEQLLLNRNSVLK